MVPPASPAIAPSNMYVSVRPELYARCSPNKDRLAAPVLTATLYVSTIGPHICIQCRLLTNPKANTR